jgi:hypothetical protein
MLGAGPHDWVFIGITRRSGAGRVLETVRQYLANDDYSNSAMRSP